MLEIYKLEEIQTPRLILRPVKFGDEAGLNFAINRTLPALQRWQLWAKDPSLGATFRFVKWAVHGWQSKNAREFMFTIINKATKEIIGAAGYNDRTVHRNFLYEVGYWLDAHYQGQGLATEVTNALTRYAFAVLHAKRVQVGAHFDNEKSIAVALRCGFVKEALRENAYIDCVSNLPTKGIILSCCSLDQLPPLEVSWRHDENKFLPPSAFSLPPTLITNKIILKPLLPQTELPLFKFKLNFYQLHHAIKVNNAFFVENKPLLNLFASASSDENAKKQVVVNKQEFLPFCLFNKNKQLLGIICYKIFDWAVPYMIINYVLNNKYITLEYDFHILAELTKYAFNNFPVKRLEIVIAENENASNVPAKLGYKFEGKLHNYVRNFVTNKICDGYLYSMTDIKQLIMPSSVEELLKKYS